MSIREFLILKVIFFCFLGNTTVIDGNVDSTHYFLLLFQLDLLYIVGSLAENVDTVACTD